MAGLDNYSGQSGQLQWPVLTTTVAGLENYNGRSGQLQWPVWTAKVAGLDNYLAKNKKLWILNVENNSKPLENMNIKFIHDITM